MRVPSRSSVDADGVVAVDVYIGPVADLRTFQVTLNLVGGDAGSVGTDKGSGVFFVIS